jgi:hypothetical protein
MCPIPVGTLEQEDALQQDDVDVLELVDVPAVDPRVGRVGQLGDQPVGATLHQGEDQPREHLLEPDGGVVEVLGGVRRAEAPGGELEPAVHVDRSDADTPLPEPGADPPGYVPLAGTVDAGNPRRDAARARHGFAPGENRRHSKFVVSHGDPLADVWVRANGLKE